MALKPVNDRTAIHPVHKERIIQFGEGNFLRAFVDWIVQMMNNNAGFDGSVVIVKPRPGSSMQNLISQDCMYHVCRQGLNNGNIVDEIQFIDCISRAINPYDDYNSFIKLANLPELRFIISNTTEAGITFDPLCRFTDTPATSFPAKLTQLLFNRFRAFSGDRSKGLILLPCELIYANGRVLADCIHQYIDLWRNDIGPDTYEFNKWVDEACHICTTLVDCIVSGLPEKNKLAQLQERTGYADELLVAAEPYHLWVIETPSSLSPKQLECEFPARQAGLNVVVTHNEKPYHERKVTLLNGPHTVLAPIAYLAGLDIVRDACQHPIVGSYVRHVMNNELLPTLNMPEAELHLFASEVMERFCNPFIDHQLTSIMLNSMSKFRTRDLPALMDYLQRYGKLPYGLVLGLAAIIVYYRGGERDNRDKMNPNDDPRIIQLLTELWQSNDAHCIAEGVLSASDLIWGDYGNLNAVSGLTDLLSSDIDSILSYGIITTIQRTFSFES